MSAISFAELEQVSGELLPARTVLSLVDALPGGGGHGTTVAYACQATSSAGTPGLVGALGLGTPAHSGLTCVPVVSAAGSGHGTTVAYSCQTMSSLGTPGLVGALGLGTPAHSSTTCVPATS